MKGGSFRCKNLGEVFGKLILFCLVVLARKGNGINFTSQPSEFGNSTFPARKFCRDGSYFDELLDVCVKIDKTTWIMPTFDPCPWGSALDGYMCKGEIFSDFEARCPSMFDANIDDQCLKAIVYSPKTIHCPKGFEFKKVGQENIRVCIKETWTTPEKVEVVPVTPIEHYMAFLGPLPDGLATEDQLIPKIIDSPVPKNMVLKCPPGSRLLIDSKGIPNCNVRIVVPPDPKKTCADGYSYSMTLGSCLTIKAVDVHKVCPFPTAKLGKGFGDWKTAKFRPHAVNNCTATEAFAKSPKCLPGYELRGYKKPRCFPKIFSPYAYDCQNYEGYALRYTEGKSPFCQYVFDAYKWAPGPPYQSRRQKVDTFRMHNFQTPYDFIEAYERGRVTKRRGGG